MRYAFIYLLIATLVFSTTHIYGQNLHLNINGESDKATKVIDSIGYRNTFPDYKRLNNQVDTLKTQLLYKGYIDAKINDVVKQNDTLYNALFFVGKRVTSVKVSMGTDFNPNWLLALNAELNDNHLEIPIEHLETTLDQLNKTIAEQGDPFSALQLVNIKKVDSATITADLKITSNQKRRIDKIVLRGYEKLPKSFVKRFLKLRTGQSFNLEEIKSKTEKLNELRFAKEIRSPEVLFTNDSTTLYLYTQKTKSNNFDGFLGFGTNENTNRLEFDGYLDLRLINNLNFGESLRLFYKSDEIDQQTFNVNLNAPYLFGSPIGLEIDLNIFRKDSTFSNTSQKAQVFYQVNSNHRLRAGIRNTVSSNLLDNSTSILDDFTATYLQLGYNYTKPQYYDPLFPINFWLDIDTSFGNRTQDDVDISQNAVVFEAYKIFNLNQRNSVFIRTTGASLISDNYLDNELYRFGGINSIRGFEENSLVANLFGVLNTEYRYRLSNSIYIHSVIDAAYFENDITDTKNRLFGFGFGLGLLTNAGLFRLNYSSGKTEDVPFRLSDSKIHVSLTATF